MNIKVKIEDQDSSPYLFTFAEMAVDYGVYRVHGETNQYMISTAFGVLHIYRNIDGENKIKDGSVAFFQVKHFIKTDEKITLEFNS